MIALQRGAACVVFALSLPAAGAAETRTTPFTHFGSGAAIALAGDGATATVEFGQRADELVTGATLHLRYAASPALDPAVSHIRVMLNDTVVGVLPVKAADAGRTVAQDLVVDPRLSLIHI